MKCRDKWRICLLKSQSRSSSYKYYWKWQGQRWHRSHFNEICTSKNVNCSFQLLIYWRQHIFLLCIGNYFPTTFVLPCFGVLIVEANKFKPYFKREVDPTIVILANPIQRFVSNRDKALFTHFLPQFPWVTFLFSHQPLVTWLFVFGN